ncbi:MAG: hypothetical protein B7Y50_05455 [Hydrogenophilales bacterium 28-61-11]|nr:MAG: hypothetical protein B7Y50_05455 [Hydrogenophilales bacterium 28-61-11]
MRDELTAAGCGAPWTTKATRWRFSSTTNVPSLSRFVQSIKLRQLAQLALLRPLAEIIVVNSQHPCRHRSANAIMASANALRSLIRPVIPVAPRIHPVVLARAPFTTSSVLAAAPPPTIKSRRDLPKKTKKTYKKKANIVAVKKPNPGERKAFRKRIQLSNNSALPVQGLDELSAEALANHESKGKMFAIPDQVVDQLRALEAFKTTQTWNLFRRPHFLVREETVEMMRKLQDSKTNKEAFKCVLTGSRLSGKSMALLQAMSHALLDGWVVFHIPEGKRRSSLKSSRTYSSQFSKVKISQTAIPNTPLSRTRPTGCSSRNRCTASNFCRTSTRPTNPSLRSCSYKTIGPR